jgi:hypothetical protein
MDVTDAPELFFTAKLPRFHTKPMDDKHFVEFDMMYINHSREMYIGVLTKCQAILADREKNPDMWFSVRGHGIYLITSISDIKHILTCLQTGLIDNPFRDHVEVPVNPLSNKIKEDEAKETIC